LFAAEKLLGNVEPKKYNESIRSIKKWILQPTPGMINKQNYAGKRKRFYCHFTNWKQVSCHEAEIFL